MDPTRWNQIENLYHAALACGQDSRAALLQSACEGNEALRSEIESLLEFHARADFFIGTPALDIAARLLDEDEIREHLQQRETLSSGTVVSHYRITGQIGAGGMGEVYRAHDPRLGRDVAIKILPALYSQNPDRLQRFEQEARAAAALTHPSIVAVYDVGTTADHIPYVVTEILEGETLRTRLRRGPLPMGDAVTIARQIASGLAAAHRKGIVHRDLKPENIFLTRQGHVKILDFGLAKLLPDSPLAEANTKRGETTQASILGTLGYMSLEQLRGEPVDQRSDLFSLGAVLYEMLSGRKAFAGNTAADIIGAILTAEPADLTPDARAIPASINGVLRQALQKQPRDRFQSAEEFATALTNASGSVADAPPVAPEPKVLFARRLALVAALVLLPLSLVLLWQIPRGTQTPPAMFVPGAIRSLGVLPFMDVSTGPSTSYFADGMTDELITQLASLRDMRVISRTSAMRFKDSRESLANIAKALDVNVIIEGSVMRAGDRVRITTQLVGVPADRQLWAQSFDGSAADLIGLEAEVARAVTAGVHGLLLPAAAARLAQPQHVAGAGAYDAYLKGRFHAAQLTPADLQSALRSFEESVAKDPDFALAYAALAETYSWGAGLGFMPPQQALEKSEQAALKALRLDPDLATAHHALAWVRYARQWDFAAAETEFRRSIELAPGNVTAHLWYGMFLAQRERRDEALRQFREARALDPLADVVAQLALTALLTSRQYPQLVSEALALQESNPQSWMIGWFVLSAYERQGALEEAIAERERQAVAFGKSATAARKEFDAYRNEYARHGPRAYWTLLRRQMSDSDATTAYERSVLDAHLGAREPMYAELAAALQSRSTQLLYWESSEPAFDPYRAEAQFRDHTAAVEQMGGNLARSVETKH
jgi:eukaryotic-like serine/threonine-protein kinase